MLGVLPGILHAWYIIAKYPEDLYETVPQGDPEGHRNERVTYYYVDHRDQQRGYGATDQTQPSAAPAAGGSGAAEGVPPTYAQAIKGDHKVQNS